MNYQIQLKSQKALDKVAVFLQFNLIFFLEKTRDHWKKSCQGMGVSIEENKYLFSPNYPDDHVIIAQDAEDLEFIFKKTDKGI